MPAVRSKTWVKRAMQLSRGKPRATPTRLAMIPPSRARRGLGRGRNQRGFSLVELMIAATIIALLAAMALPASKRTGQSAKASAVANDLRVFATAFSTHAQQNGSYPPEAAVAVMPPAMVGALGNTAWRRKTPIGGAYNWDNARPHGSIRPRAAIAITSRPGNPVTIDTALLLAIDRKIDDGNLATGNFYRGAANEPVYIIER
jgi:prepilin-type N-terminal cleavage/methylation domain-containing protein